MSTFPQRRKRNKQVAVHPYPEHRGVQGSRRGEVALWTTPGHQEVGAVLGVAGWGGDVDTHGHKYRGVCLWAPLCFPPPPRGETEAQNAQPLLCHEALPCAFGARA